MGKEPGWYDDPDPWYQRYWDGSEWSERQAKYPPNPQPDFRTQSQTAVKRANLRAAWALAIAAVFALNDVIVLPIGYSAINDTTFAAISFMMIPFGTLAAILILTIYVRKLRLAWANGLGIVIGIVMASSAPLGLFITTAFHMN